MSKLVMFTDHGSIMTITMDTATAQEQFQAWVGGTAPNGKIQGVTADGHSYCLLAGHIIGMVVEPVKR